MEYANAQKILQSFFKYTNIGNDFTFNVESHFSFGSDKSGPHIIYTYFSKSNDTVFVNALYDPTEIIWSYEGSIIEDSIKYSNPYSDLNYFHLSTSSVDVIVDDKGKYVKDTIWNQHDSTFYIGTSKIQEQNGVKSISIFPNPTQQTIYLSLAASELIVYNSFGQIVLKANAVPEQQPIMVAELNNGLYFIALFDKGKNKVGAGKFYKQ